jgi:hypothetical protein
MRATSGKPGLSQRWENLYKDALFEADVPNMPRRIQLAKHAILDRLEDVTCAKNKQVFEAGELVALRRAHRTLIALEQLYVPESATKVA